MCVYVYIKYVCVCLYVCCVCGECVCIFLAAIWLPHHQLWVIIKGQTHSPPDDLCVILVSTWETLGACSKVGSLSPIKQLVRFELETFRFLPQCLNQLGHYYIPIYIYIYIYIYILYTIYYIHKNIYISLSLISLLLLS